MTNLSTKHPRAQSGFSLIEVLISLLILGVGLLGLGGLQIASMKGAGNAHSRNAANMLAMELGDRMRANPLGVAGGFYDNDVNCSTDETQCRENTSCSAEETARFDVQEIMCGMKRSTRREGGVANLLPSGDIQVDCPSGCTTPPKEARALHNVVITWGDRNLHEKQAGNMQEQTLTVPVIP